ncbi:Crp/Fnr family transcriptional regulator [uncultured Chryseobacterium sp.]|uniref:Crp/Fnr family transcriptional regulator n=1 Tax=uncultured Chryseobacterium sp. TaxID=259322 RepID=UPI0025F8C6E7|nr:Crp/Fnr family transcriptional regulator [uncultured Chryseobacterium sp.]
MLRILIKHIRQKVDLSEQDAALLKTFFFQKNLTKKQFLLREGEVCNHFAFEGWWISDFNSFINREKALLNIDAIENSELLLISFENYERLTLKIPVMDRYFRILYQNSLVTKDRRLMISNKSTAEEKYLSMVRSSPEIAKRIPHSLIASYLGLSPETVSRIRKKLLFQ